MFMTIIMTANLFTILAVKLKMINQDGMIFNRFPSNFAKAIFYLNPNSPENFGKLYSVFKPFDM